MIREATPHDYGAVAALANHMHNAHIAARPDVLKNEMFFTQEHFLHYLQDESAKVFVYEEDDNILGYCIVKSINYQQHIVYHDMLVCVIGGICVCENARGKGIGRKLFEYAKAHAKEIGAAQLELNVWKFNKDAREFYEHLGLTEKSATMEIKL